MKEHSAGILVIYDHKALLCHATNALWNYCMPPKGHIEEDEDAKDAAQREMIEEIGILIDKSKLNESFLINYSNKNEKSRKDVLIFVVHINSLSEIGLSNEEVPKEMLQLEENDSAKFYNENEIKSYCFWRYREDVLKYL